MKQRSWLALLVGAIAAYLLAHAGLAARAVYEVHETLQHPAVAMDFELRDMREGYSTLVALFILTGMLGVSSLVSSVGLYRNRRWGVALWSATSLALVATILYAVIFRAVEWTNYLYELGMVLLSWLYVFIAKRSAHDA